MMKIINDVYKYNIKYLLWHVLQINTFKNF